MSDLSVYRQPTVPLDEPSLVQYKLCSHHKREGASVGTAGSLDWFPKKLKNFFLDGSVQQTNQNESN